MKKLGFFAFVALIAATVSAQPADADPPVWYCELTGAGYQYASQDGYQICIENCVVLDSQNQPQQGECWLSPPPPQQPPGTPDQPPGGPDNQT